jgi:hypothetical protein
VAVRTPCRARLIERFFACINRNSRFENDFDAKIESVEAFLDVTSSFILLLGLAR